MSGPDEFLVLLFHSVDDRDLLSLRDLGNIRPEVFEKAVIELKKEFDMMSMDDMVKCFSGQMRGPDRPLAITFDDGAESYASRAVPIMASHGVPSTCFLITDCIDDRALYWRYLYNYCVHAGRGRELEGLVREEYGVPAGEGGIIRFTRNNFSKEKTEGITGSILGSIVSEAEYRDREGRLFLSSGDIERLKKDSLVDFGIHTCSHPVMIGLSDEEIRHEISGSLDSYRKWIGNDVPMFSVPFGRLYKDYDDRTVLTAGNLSIEYIFSAYGGGNGIGQPVFNIRRIPVREDVLKEGARSFINCLRKLYTAHNYAEEEARLLSAVEGWPPQH